jgi:hypothetical protein
VQLIFGNLWPWFGQFTHLMPLGLRIFPQQQSSTLTAGIRFALHNPLNLVRRFEFATMSMMSLLPSRFSPRRLSFGPRWCPRPIRRRRLRRVSRILVELLFQSRYLSFQTGNLFLQHGHLLSQRAVFVPKHTDDNLNRERRSFPVFLRNRHPCGQIHSHSVLRDPPSFYCIFSSKIRLFATCQSGFIPN